MCNSTQEIPLKQCSRNINCCHTNGPVLPATLEYFGPDKRSKDGLRAECRKCHNKDNQLYRQTPQGKEKHRASEANRRQKTGVKEYYNNYARERYATDPNYRKRADERTRQRRQTDAFKEWNKNYSLRPDVKARTQAFKKHRAYHRDGKYKDYKSEWYQSKKGDEHFKALRRAATNRRRARSRQLPDTLNVSDWYCALEYFNGCCAVCGRQLSDLFGEHTAAMDHWIPLSSPKCPGTLPTNIVPLCHGANGCNNSKGGEDPEKWLAERFGNRKAKQILERIETYFEWVREQNE